MWLICMFQVTFTEEHISFLHFLTNVCAIVGGNYQMIINLVTSWFILTIESSDFLDFCMFYEFKLWHSIFHMIINFINFLVNCRQSSWNFNRIFCSILHSWGFFFFRFHLISDACSAWVSKLLKGYWSPHCCYWFSFFDAQAMLFFRCFYRVWNIRFVYIPWSEGNQEEDGNWQIQLNGSVGVSCWCNCWFACQWLYGQNQDRKVEACNE